VENLELGEQFIKVEIFCKDKDGFMKWRAVCEKKPDSVLVGKFDQLYYKFIQGTNDALIIYFDYSRNSEKIKLYEEYLPKFSMRTDSSLLLIANVFGFWGTAISFSSDGHLIINDVLKLILEQLKISKASRIYIVGGSQGASAALLYGNFLRGVEQIHAVVPVQFTTESMLMHIKDNVASEDIMLCETKILSTLSQKNVFLYSTLGDTLWYSWHRDLSLNSEKVRFIVCDDPAIKHDNCLKYYIKYIYASIYGNEVKSQSGK
jgi:hypothetical protein